MADALCGPSNPLQSFRKQTQLDRTLQQDRLVGRTNSPAEQFRSQDPRAGSLDADLHAFEHAQPNPLEFHQPPLFNGFRQQHQAPASAGWAADFQRLHVSQTPGPVPVSQFRTEAPLIRSTTGGWHDDFLRHSGNVTPVNTSIKGKEALRPVEDVSQAIALGHGLQPSMPPYTATQNGRMLMDPQADTSALQDYEMQLQLLSEQNRLRKAETGSYRASQVSDEAFEAAFQDAFMAEAQALQQQEASPVLQAEQGHDFDLARDELRIGSDAIDYTEVADRTMDQDTRDADELARTAGQLLNLVQHDTSQKFQNSQFLDLMRKLRDREVEVQNNDMVSKTNGMSDSEFRTANTSGGANVEQHQDPYPAATASNENQWMFPDMNDIYAPTNNELDTASHSYSGDVTPNSRTRFPGSWDYPVTYNQNGLEQTSSVQMNDPMYHTSSDEFPASQVQALHPGGKYYPHSPQQQSVEMSGAVSQGVLPNAFGESLTQERGFASRSGA